MSLVSLSLLKLSDVFVGLPVTAKFNSIARQARQEYIGTAGGRIEQYVIFQNMNRKSFRASVLFSDFCFASSIVLSVEQVYRVCDSPGYSFFTNINISVYYNLIYTAQFYTLLFPQSHLHPLLNSLPQQPQLCNSLNISPLSSLSPVLASSLRQHPLTHL